MRWTCTNNQGIKKSGCFFSAPAWCYIWYLCCYMMWSNYRNELALFTILFLTLKSGLPPPLVEARTLCGLKIIGIRLVFYYGKISIHVQGSYCVCVPRVFRCTQYAMTLKTACLSCLCLLMLCTYPLHYSFL